MRKTNEVMKKRTVVKTAVPFNFKSNLFITRALSSVPNIIDSKAIAPVKIDDVAESMPNWNCMNSVMKPRKPFKIMPSVTVDNIMATSTKLPKVFFILTRKPKQLFLKTSINLRSFFLKPLSFAVLAFDSSSVVGLVREGAVVCVNEANENANVIKHKMVHNAP